MVHDSLQIKLKLIKCTPKIMSKSVIFGRTHQFECTDSQGRTHRRRKCFLHFASYLWVKIPNTYCVHPKYFKI